MRLLRSGLNEQQAYDMKTFAQWILDIGDGKINEPNDGEAEITIPDDLLVAYSFDPIKTMVNEVYGEDFVVKRDALFFRNRAILSPRNQDVESINDYMLSQIKGEERTYLSSDSIETSDKGVKDNMVYSQEFLNSIKISGLPNHNIRLKVGVSVMLLRNLDPKGGLCNGIRLLITHLYDHVVEATIISGDDDLKEHVLIPRMFVSPPDSKFPFRMRRKQFPLPIAYAITINKNQRQTLKSVGLFLPRPVFTHGQLYVDFSRVTSRTGLKVLIVWDDGKPKKNTINIVFKEIFDDI